LVYNRIFFHFFKKKNMNDLKLNHKATWTAIIIILVVLYVWYNYIFYDTWLSMNKLTPEMVEENLTMIPYIVSFFTTVLTVYVLDIIFSKLKVDSITAGVGVALTFGFAFTFLNVLGQDLYASRPLEISFIDGGANLMVFAIAGGILGGWNNFGTEDG
jgi:predicted tellurium resistance membrane protein TerC